MRCAIPSAGFFEWNRQKRKFLFTAPDNGALYMAGLYSIWNGKPSYVILTTDANDDSMREIHHRMPLVLQKEQVSLWLIEPEATEEFLHMTPPMLTRVAVDAQLQLW